MRDYYKIESVLLDDISRNINSEKTSFTQGARKTFSNSYLKTCSDTSIKLMSSHIEELYSKINSGYNSLSTWLTDYTNDAKNVEKGLSSSDYNVTDFYTNMTLKATLNHKDVDINKSPDVIDGLNNSNKTNYPYIVNGNIDSSYETLPYTIGDDSKEKVALYNETVSLSGKKYDERGFEINEVVEVDYDELISQKQQLLASLNTIEEELKKEEAELIEKRSELVEVLKNNSPTRAKPYGNAEYQEASEKYKEYSKQLSEIQATITLVEMYAKQTQDEIDLAPYSELKDTTEFKNFRDNYNRTEAYEIKDALETGKNQYDALADYEKNGSGGYVFKLVEGDFETEVTVEDFSRYATEDEKMVYHYLAATKGEQTANQYLIKLVDNINMMKGAELANAKLYDIRTTIEEEENADSAIEAAWMGLSNTFQSWGLGLIDGTDSFINGFANWFSRDKHMSAEQYATIITAQYLTQHKYGTSYEIGKVTGNMLPALAISVVTRAGLLGLALPAEVAGLYAEVLGTTMMGLSAGGNAKVNAMQNLGANPTSALLYGFLIGSSESLLGRYLGNIPGLSQEAGFTLAGILREGLEEASQDAFAAVVEAIMYGKPINLDELTDDMTKSFLMGVLMSFGTTGVTTVISMKIDGLDYEIKGEDLLKLAESSLKDNRGSINLAAIKQSIKQKANHKYSSIETVEELIKKNNVSEEVAEIMRKYLVSEEVANLLLKNPDMSINDALSEIQNSKKWRKENGKYAYPDDNGAAGVAHDYVGLQLRTIISDALKGTGVDINTATISELNTALEGTGIKFIKSQNSRGETQLGISVEEEILQKFDITGVTIDKLNDGEIITRVGSYGGSYVGVPDNTLASQSVPLGDCTDLYVGRYKGSPDDKIYYWEETIEPAFGEIGGGKQRYILSPDKKDGTYIFRTRNIAPNGDGDIDFDSTTFNYSGWTPNSTSIKKLAADNKFDEIIHVSNLQESDLGRNESFEDYATRKNK
ncbi:MAG: hypothetical protein IKF36_03710 [Bacilli bacterium]|nr:hypothetical protein [Bacilli bacterium]